MDAKQGDLNEYDAAIAFMLYIMLDMKVLSEDKEAVERFIEIHCEKIKSVSSSARMPYSEIIELIRQIEEESGIIEE